LPSNANARAWIVDLAFDQPQRRFEEGLPQPTMRRVGMMSLMPQQRQPKRRQIQRLDGDCDVELWRRQSSTAGENARVDLARDRHQNGATLRKDICLGKPFHRRGAEFSQRYAEKTSASLCVTFAPLR
jgi:hypothetical protein